ncbi:putative ABC transporter ATP-binding protein YlmA [Roseimaritima multifibrata]|uniref:Putative ABC transporter ATP-binding protein YlmA n=1 Tax=Roseimaritima multifibrata TaxID=1930274 RepID=A0A517MCC6_9BACT|nr:ATP-binding cassette domain-containing protein [Roseimaritima multifibrata]QDS92542.1 putative ABC transporter ATP-binding protein YlmA [Roseimaritima multifibrata]
MSNSTLLLELDQVTVNRGEVRILDSVSAQIPLGRHTAILGPNGSGKTSLLKLLMRQFYPSITDSHAGQVRILGRSDWHIDDLRKQLGIVSNELDHTFASGRSGRMTALEATLSGFSGVQLKRHLKYDGESAVDLAHEALRQVGAQRLTERTLETMSTGERRRVLIARALVHSPKALILDEPTTGLDIAARTALLEQLEKLAEGGTTLLLVTHHLEEIIPAIEHVMLLGNGRVEMEGQRGEVLTDEPLSKLFGLPLHVVREGEYLFARPGDQERRV